MTEQIKLPYLTYPKKTAQYFKRLKEVEVPEKKFTYDFLENVMLFKGNNDRYLLSLLKKLGFLDQSGTPTNLYKENIEMMWNHKKYLLKVFGMHIMNCLDETKIYMN